MNGIISSIDFKDTVNGKEIEKEDAIKASKEVDSANKPVVPTPGKRARLPATAPGSASSSKSPKTT